jgi:hypothetical protein
MALGRVAGAEVRDDGRVLWAIGNSPIAYFNCVAYADLAAEEADREIAAPGCFVPGGFRRGPDASGARISTPRIRHSVDGIHPILPYHCQGKPMEGEPRWES